MATVIWNVFLSLVGILAVIFVGLVIAVTLIEGFKIIVKSFKK